MFQQVDFIGFLDLKQNMFERPMRHSHIRNRLHVSLSAIGRQVCVSYPDHCCTCSAITI